LFGHMLSERAQMMPASTGITLQYTEPIGSSTISVRTSDLKMEHLP